MQFTKYAAILVVIFVSLWQTEANAASYGTIQDLYNKNRIPEIVVATDGTVLAFGKNATLVRRSSDGGKTWSQAKQIDKKVEGSAVVDITNGDVLVVTPMFQSLWRSKDQGETWRKEKIVVKSNPAGHGSPESGIPAKTMCSESGITLQYGKHKGRLLMPARVQPPKGSNDQKYWMYAYNTAIFSDDHGKTWQTSGPIQSGTGEGTLAEFSNGDVYYNSRSHMAVDHRRQISNSYDGGAMFVDWRVDQCLREVGLPFYFKYGTKPSYGISAGLVRMPLEATGGKDVLIYSMPDTNGGGRERMTVWASFDRGDTWPIKRLVFKGPSAYSSLAADKDGTIYLIFERGEKKPYEKISVVRMNVDWILQGKKTGCGKIPGWAKKL